ncbi:hypothetical protein ACNS7O_10540 [Haloferacaceae archaeon DSL9]
MQVVCLGVGQAGGSLLDTMVDVESSLSSGCIVDAVAIDTAQSTLGRLRRLPTERRVLISPPAGDEADGAADLDRGAEAMDASLGNLFALLQEVDIESADAIVLCADLSDETSGGAPLLARALRETYDCPLYGVGIVPPGAEDDPAVRTAARSFSPLLERVDSLVLFDRSAWLHAGSRKLELGFPGIDSLADQLLLCFTADERPDGTDPTAMTDTLETGGVAVVGLAEESLPSKSLLSRLSDRSEYDSKVTGAVLDAVESAATESLSAACTLSGIERALVIVGGPDAVVSDDVVAAAGDWVESNTGATRVRTGTYPEPNVRTATAIVVFAGAYDVPRVKQLQGAAVERRLDGRDRPIDELLAAADDATSTSDADDS